MGRSSTGAWTTIECKRIELKQLLKLGYFRKGCEMQGSFAWTDGSSITINCNLSGNNSYLRLIYSTKNNEGQKKDYDYKVKIVFVPSNLGKGEIMYFICPVSFKRCRILYKGYYCPIWKCRDAYNNRIYYPLQLSTKKGIYNDRYWQLENELEKLYNKRKATTYKGRPTKRAIRLEQLCNAKEMADYHRWSLAAMPISLQKALQGRDISTML